MSRLAQLQKMLEKTPGDTFLLYGLALERKKAGENQLALEYLDKVIAVDRFYNYAYYQKGQILESLGQTDAAKAAYVAGIAAARESGDDKALGELQGAHEML